MRASVHAVATMCLVVLTASCGGGKTPSAARPTSTATIAIAAPRADQVIAGKKVDLRIILHGGRIVKETSRDLTPSEGHVHVSIDGAVLSQTYGLSQSLDAPKAGKHLLQVEFVAKDHGPFDPRVIASVPFTVKR